MSESIRVSGIVPAPPERIFAAWLDSKAHSQFTGGEASVEGTIGGTFTVWDGYIQGTTLDAQPPRRIIQSWRSLDFPPEAPPSRLEIIFEGAEGGTQVTFVHSEIPDGQGSDYEKGWKVHYLEPMRRHFGKAPQTAARPVARPAAAKKAKKPKSAARRTSKPKKASKAPRAKPRSKRTR